MKKRKKTGGAGKMIKILLFLCLLGIVCFGLVLGILVYVENHPAAYTNRTDAIVVLGAQVYEDGTVSPQLQYRLEKALEAYRDNPRPIAVCGAKGGNEPAPEGEVMKAWLVDMGVPEGDIIAECESYNTYQNLRNIRALLPEETRTVTVITSDYHLPRALAIARSEGFEAEGIGSPCIARYWIKNHFREVLAWGKFYLQKIIPLS